MSDFIGQLLSRNLVRGSHAQSIQPRLPSLFETPITNQSELGVSVTKKSGQLNNQSEPRHWPSRIAAPEPDPFQMDEQEDHAQKVHYPGGATIVSQPHGYGQNHSYLSIGQGQPSYLNPLFKTTGDSNGQMNVSTDYSNSSVIASFAVKPDIKTLRFGSNWDSFEKKNDSEPKEIGESTTIRDLANMRMDSTMPDQIVTDKIALYTNRTPFVHHKNESTSTPSQFTPLMVPANLSKLGIQWPSASANHSSEDKQETLADPAEQVINVTIGRIEIRATQAAPVDRRKNQTPKAATMSLDDYLNKRNGGAR